MFGKKNRLKNNLNTKDNLGLSQKDILNLKSFKHLPENLQEKIKN